MNLEIFIRMLAYWDISLYTNDDDGNHVKRREGEIKETRV